MKKKILSLLFLPLMLPFALSSDGTGHDILSEDRTAIRSGETPQSTQKEKFDYMSSILSRNTQPLGLKENVALRKLLNQSSIKWAMRSGGRHILN
jgi:hypothetical protein